MTGNAFRFYIYRLIQEQIMTQMTMQERLDAEAVERDALAKQAEALKLASEHESRAAIEKLQQAQQEAAAAAASAKQELADKQDMVIHLCSVSPSQPVTVLWSGLRPAYCLSRCWQDTAT